MRTVVVAALVLLVLPVCFGSEQAVAQTSPVGGGKTAVTIEQAVAQLGAPTTERHCENEGTILSWHVSPAPVALPASPTSSYAKAVDAVAFRTVAVRSASATEYAILVVRFDSNGRMLWGRELPGTARLEATRFR